MKTNGSDSAAVVEFTGKVQRIARVHQLGLMDKASRQSKRVLYPARILLALNESDISFVEEVIFKHLIE